ncbi:unnamed protein product [Ixodes persulcatus]
MHIQRPRLGNLQCRLPLGTSTSCAACIVHIPSLQSAKNAWFLHYSFKVRFILQHWQCCPPCTISSTSETSLYTTNSRLISFLLFMHNKSFYRYVCCNTITSNLKALLPTTENRRETEGAGNKPTGGTDSQAYRKFLSITNAIACICSCKRRK